MSFRAADKWIVVTGASSGIGKATAKLLVERGAHVVALCRNPAKARDAANEMKKGPGTLDLVIGDLGTIATSRKAAESLLNLCPRIDVLINNAGVWMTRRVLNEDGLESTFMVNHVAPFMLSLLLLDRLRAGGSGRIVNVNSGLYAIGSLSIKETPTGLDFGRFKTYANSKFCNMLATIELAERVEDDSITVIAVHPGVIRTSLGETGGPLGLMLRMTKLFWGRPAGAAEIVAYIATARELASKNGCYFDRMTETPIISRARDRVLARSLWERTADLTGLSL
jgi:NAD(P)-dependent dehydrogenase (short-subunit alcohol dehydrogenase family)